MFFKMRESSEKQRCLLAPVAIIGLCIGGVIGYFGSPLFYTKSESDQQMIKLMEKLIEDKWLSEAHFNQKMIDLVSTNNLRNNLKEVSSRPHLASSERDEELAELIQSRFKEAGFDTSQLVPYKVLLSRPDNNKPNLITIQNGKGQVIFQSKFTEEWTHPTDENSEVNNAFNAYAPAGDITTSKGEGVVYVNYARQEDFAVLEKLGVNISGQVVMARYGKIFRGNQLIHAQQHGAVGVILFSDPQDVAQEGLDADDVYPNTFWLPGSGIQRGSVFFGGDPLTPGWPSTEHAYRIELDEVRLPKIPCQPIGYDDARVILGMMSGTESPSDWKGYLNATHLGPNLRPEFSDFTLRLQTHNTVNTYTSYNVIATITGDVEPDRYVLVGNHRDAWGFGASDPSSGTSQLLESARVLGELMKEGWRPRRTIIFCSWGAEEYGLIGSTEWVQEHVDKLQERAVTYINIDICSAGPILHANGSPLIWDAVKDIAKMIPGVRNGTTLYDEWAAYHAIKNRPTPLMKTLAGGSDHAAFTSYCGIPCVDVKFMPDKNQYDIPITPSYHTGFDTFNMVEKHVDPGFRIHQGCSRLSLLILKYFADAAMIPYNVVRLSEAIKKSHSSLMNKGADGKLLKIYDKFPFLEESIDNFTVATHDFAAKLHNVKSNSNPVTLRAINDVLMKLEKIFILPEGLPGRPETRHAIFAPSQFNSYATSGFPGISDLLYKIDDLEGIELLQRQKDIKRHVSDLTILFQRASNLLKDFHVV